MFKIVCTKTNCLIAYVRCENAQEYLKGNAYYVAIYEEE